MIPRAPKVSQRAPKVSQKGAKGNQKEPKGAQREPKGAKREPKGARGEPTVSQRATKMHPKGDLRKRTRKGCQKTLHIFVILVDFGNHFPSKIDEKIDAEIDAEKVMKIDETSMRKWYRN